MLQIFFVGISDSQNYGKILKAPKCQIVDLGYFFTLNGCLLTKNYGDSYKTSTSNETLLWSLLNFVGIPTFINSDKKLFITLATGCNCPGRGWPRNFSVFRTGFNQYSRVSVKKKFSYYEYEKDKLFVTH